MSEDFSRRKALSLLGFGAVLGFTLSAVLEPSGGRSNSRDHRARHPARRRTRSGHRDARVTTRQGRRSWSPCAAQHAAPWHSSTSHPPAGTAPAPQ